MFYIESCKGVCQHYLYSLRCRNEYLRKTLAYIGKTESKISVRRFSQKNQMFSQFYLLLSFYTPSLFI